jgi:hypothetical protein
MEETKNRRHYDDQFKRDAVRLLTEGGQKISQASLGAFSLLLALCYKTSPLR